MHMKKILKRTGMFALLGFICLFISAGTFSNMGVRNRFPKEKMPLGIVDSYLYYEASKIDPDDVIKEIESLQNKGLFDKVNQVVDEYLSNSKIDSVLRKKLLFEQERSKRIKMDYTLKENELYLSLNNILTGFSKREFLQWQSESRFDLLTWDGEKHFFSSSKSNLFFRYPELKKRRVDYKKADPFAKGILAHIRNLKNTAGTQKGVVRLPRKTSMYQSLTLKKGIVPAGKNLECWLPYPIVFENQDNVMFVSASVPPRSIDSEKSKIRSAYFKTQSKGNSETTLDIRYNYTCYSYYNRIDTKKVENFNKTEEVYKDYTKEEPHVIFTEKITNLAKTITGTETNPYLKGMKIYNWICDNIKYSYAREYSTIHNISEYTLDRHYGDCGQEALLFITLCRVSGVPARWQSGFVTYPGKQFLHDWAEIYIKPYGWIPVDTYMGVYFTSITEDLTKAERKEVRDFYFGNIDYYRMVANKGHGLELNPSKTFFRSDDVDFQRGEIETDAKNLFFNDWSYKFRSE